MPWGIDFQKGGVHRMHWRAPWLREAREPGKMAVADAACILISYNLIGAAKLGYLPGLTKGSATISLAWIVMSYGLGRYTQSDDGKNAAKDFRDLTLIAIISLSIISLFVGHSWLYQIVDAQTRFRGFLLPLFMLASLLSFGSRRALQAKKKKTKQWLAIGTEEEIRVMKYELEIEHESVSKSISLHPSEDWRHINDILKSNDGLALGTTNNEDKELEATLLDIRSKGKSIAPIVNWCENNLSRIPPELVSAEWLVRAEGFSLRPGNVTWRIKRLLDVFGALLLLVVTSPIVIVAGMLIWLEDKQPVFYRQVRSGLYGKPITIWKLRSMKVDSETSGARWASASDPRVTKIGRIIRATRVDELPQLVAVIKGELSLIGPRPERPEIERELEKEIAHYRVRHWIRPGLSGWAQVCYPYGASVEDSRMKLSYDIYYLRNSGPLLDLAIALRTIKMIAWAKGSKPESK